MPGIRFPSNHIHNSCQDYGHPNTALEEPSVAGKETSCKEFPHVLACCLLLTLSLSLVQDGLGLLYLAHAMDQAIQTMQTQPINLAKAHAWSMRYFRGSSRCIL